MNKVINISYRGEQPGASSEIGSLALAQELPEQRQLSVADVAAIIDDMHGVVDPCQNTRDNNSYFALPEVGSNLKQHQQQYLLDKYSSTSSLENLASKFGGSCAVKQGKPIGFEIYAFWTNEEIADNYKLICPVGRLDNQRRVQSRFRLRIEVSNASAIDFSYFVLEREGFAPFKNLEWISGNVVNQYGRAKSIADPKWDRGGRLYWSENIRSGHIFAEFDTIYDRWDCTLQGVWTDGKRDYNATVTAIWEGDPVSLPLDVPDAGAEESETCTEILNDADAVDLSVPSNDPPETTGGSGTPEEPSGCYQVTITDYYHPCTDDYVRSEETQVPAPCDGFDDLDGPNPPVIYKDAFIGVGDPDFAGGTDCANGCTAAQYEEICCRPPDESFCVPTCLEWHSKNQGGLLPPGGMEALKKEYGDDFQLIWVYPEDGDCGVHTDRLIVPSKICCDGVTEMQWDYVNTGSLVGANSSITIYLLYGASPKTVTIEGKGFSLSDQFDLKKLDFTGNSFEIYTDSDPCCKVDINVDDGCSEVNEVIGTTSSGWNNVTPSFPSPADYGYVLSSCNLYGCLIAPDCYGYNRCWPYDGKWHYSGIYRWRYVGCDGGGECWNKSNAPDEFALTELNTGLTIVLLHKSIAPGGAQAETEHMIASVEIQQCIC